MADLEKLAEELSALTVLEAAELYKMLEEKWGVSASAPVAVAAAPAGGGAADRLGRALLDLRAAAQGARALAADARRHRGRLGAPPRWV